MCVCFSLSVEVEQHLGTALLELGLPGITQGCLHLGVFSPTLLPLVPGGFWIQAASLGGGAPWASSGDVPLAFSPWGLLPHPGSVMGAGAQA